MICSKNVSVSEAIDNALGPSLRSGRQELRSGRQELRSGRQGIILVSGDTGVLVFLVTGNVNWWR